MKIELDLRKTIEENAANYFEKAKKARGKIEGAKKAIAQAKEKKEQNKNQTEIKINAPKKIRKKHWYEKFKWFKTSKGKLVIAGRDATTNEIIIKKHSEQEDLVFHTEAPGSPFVIIKNDGTTITEEEKKEAADFCACHSKAWKLGLGGIEVFYIKPEQVTKKTKSGEYMGKGSFMIYGERTFIKEIQMKLAATTEEKIIMIAPERTIKNKNIKEYPLIIPGEEKTSSAAKKIAKYFNNEELDTIIAALPSGGCTIKMIKEKN